MDLGGSTNGSAASRTAYGSFKNSQLIKNYLTKESFIRNLKVIMRECFKNNEANELWSKLVASEIKNPEEDLINQSVDIFRFNEIFENLNFCGSAASKTFTSPSIQFGSSKAS